MTGGMRADEAGDGRTSPVASSDPVQQQQPAQPAQPAQPRTVTLLRRPSSGPGHPRSPTLALALALAAGSTTATATARAASEGTGGGQRSPTPDAAYRHPHAPEDGDGDGDDADARSPPSDSRAGSSSRASSSSPAPSTPAEPERLTTSSSAAGLRAGNDDDPVTQSCPPLDDALVLALGLPKDRLLLLRAEMEMERFVADAERTRLPLAPPHFAPGLNSYQRLLVHRLADTFGITREVEPSPRPLGPAATVVPTAALVVLVKGPDSRLPLQKLSSYLDVPAPAPLTSASSPPSPSSSSTHLPAPTTQHKYKILPRHHATSSASSSTGADDDSARGGRARRDKSLEEREQAYKEARERIFRANEERITRPSSAGSTYSRAESASTSGSVQQQQQQQQPVFYPPQVMQQTQYSHQQQQQQRPPQLRPSAPSFDPHGGGWTPYAYGPEFPQVDYSYGWPHEQTAYGGGGSGPADWAAQQRRMPPFDPRASTSNVPGYAYQQQPPIQVTAPSPHPHPHPYALALAGPAPQYPTHSPQPWVQRPPIPSPALSTSSGGSAGGYLMRFPDPTASGGNVTPGSTHRSVSSTSISSASSTSTSRNASTSSLPRRTTHSASHSLSSNRSDASGSVRRSASASTDGSGEPPAAAPTASKAPLHPSLPAKPGWLTALPPPVERTSHDRKSSFGSNTSSAPPSHPHTPPSFPPAPELYNAPPPTQFYPPPQWQHSPDPYYPPQQQPQVFYHPAPDQQTFYHHPTPPPPPLDAELGPEMRRPPPRSTLLFNPNDPGPGGNMKRSGSGGGRGASRIPQPKSVAGTDGIERGVDKIGLVG